MTEPNNELDKLLSAGTTRIGNEPGDSNSLAQDEEENPNPEAEEE